MRKSINTSNGAFKAQFARVMRLSDELLNAEAFYNDTQEKEIAGSIVAKKAQYLAEQMDKLQQLGEEGNL